MTNNLDAHNSNNFWIKLDLRMPVFNIYEGYQGIITKVYTTFNGEPVFQVERGLFWPFIKKNLVTLVKNHQYDKLLVDKNEEHLQIMRLSRKEICKFDRGNYTALYPLNKVLVYPNEKKVRSLEIKNGKICSVYLNNGSSLDFDYNLNWDKNDPSSRSWKRGQWVYKQSLDDWIKNFEKNSEK